MEEELMRFSAYLEQERQMAHNTLVSYERDLRQMKLWLSGFGITEAAEVTEQKLVSYLTWLTQEGKAATTISRVIASMKLFFSYELKQGLISSNPAENLKAPKVEKKAPTVLTGQEIEALLAQTGGRTLKKLRDHAMLGLLCATGLRVSELVDLKASDVNLAVGMVSLKENGRERMIPFSREVQDALEQYLVNARDNLLKDNQTDCLFVNVNGKPMTRQGFWKIIKYYGDKAGIRKDITPQVLRNSFAANLVENGTDMHSLQNMLGHSDVSVTHALVSFLEQSGQVTGRPAASRGYRTVPGRNRT